MNFGGSCEIRTHGRFNPSPVFKTGAFNRSAKLPVDARPISGALGRNRTGTGAMPERF